MGKSFVGVCPFHFYGICNEQESDSACVYGMSEIKGGIIVEISLSHLFVNENRYLQDIQSHDHIKKHQITTLFLKGNLSYYKSLFMRIRHLAQF